MGSGPDRTDEDLEIPAFLKRPVVSKVATPSEGVPMARSESEVEVVEAVEAETTPQPKARKAAAKPKAAKVAPKAPKTAKAPAKAPAKAKAPAQPRKAALPLDVFGYRDGSMKSRAAVMYSTKKGATLGEVKSALGSTQLNLLKDLESRGFKVTRTKESGQGKRQVTRYHLGKK